MFDPISVGAALLLKGKIAAFLAKGAAGHAAGAAAGHGAAGAYYYGPDPSQAAGYYGGGPGYYADPSQAAGYYGSGPVYYPDPSQAYAASGGGYYGGPGNPQGYGCGPNIGSDVTQHVASRAASTVAGKAVNAVQDRSIRSEIHDMLEMLVYEGELQSWKADQIWASAQRSNGSELRRIWRNGMTEIQRCNLA